MQTEIHPFKLWMPSNARLLMLGTFPPAPKRWCMEWYYPNFQNDMWRIFGLVFFGDKQHFVLNQEHTFDLPALKNFLAQTGIAIFDTALQIQRTKGTASDKDLKIVKQADIDAMLNQLPNCTDVLTAGQLATRVFTTHLGITSTPPMGGNVSFNYGNRPMRLWRMPSSSRAYPLAVEKKAAYYAEMFSQVFGSGISKLNE